MRSVAISTWKTRAIRISVTARRGDRLDDPRGVIEHPVSQRSAAAFHAGLALAYLLAMGFHAVSAWAHWRVRRREG